ncbi:UNVERIFIED_CONTAM: hypothetical protein ABID98_003394 [Brevibacillus sp. OAP136]
MKRLGKILLGTTVGAMLLTGTALALTSSSGSRTLSALTNLSRRSIHG